MGENETMTDLKLSSWIIVLAIFSTGFLVSMSWIVAIDDAYPAGNISAEWSSFDKLSSLSNTTTKTRTDIASGETGKLSDFGEMILVGVPQAVLGGLSTIGLLDDMLYDFANNAGIDMPSWVATLTIIIIVISLIFTIISAWLKRSV